jgi:hypothetical protein
MSEQPVVLRFPVAQEGAFVNACLVETAAGVVAVDSLLTVSESRAMRHALERLGKPLQAVLLTHSGVTFDGVRFTVIDLGPSESPRQPRILGAANIGPTTLCSRSRRGAPSSRG